MDTSVGATVTVDFLNVTFVFVVGVDVPPGQAVSVSVNFARGIPLISAQGWNCRITGLTSRTCTSAVGANGVIQPLTITALSLDEGLKPTGSYTLSSGGTSSSGTF